MPFFKVARLPEFVIQIRPVYPSVSKNRNVESEVITEVYIDENGKVRKVSILRSGGVDFDKSVMLALNQSKFRPAFAKDGQPVSVKVRIPFKFELD